jgi:hypothetical protein
MFLCVCLYLRKCFHSPPPFFYLFFFLDRPKNMVVKRREWVPDFDISLWDPPCVVPDQGLMLTLPDSSLSATSQITILESITATAMGLSDVPPFLDVQGKSPPPMAQALCRWLANKWVIFKSPSPRRQLPPFVITHTWQSFPCG